MSFSLYIPTEKQRKKIDTLVLDQNLRPTLTMTKAFVVQLPGKLGRFITWVNNKHMGPGLVFLHEGLIEKASPNALPRTEDCLVTPYSHTCHGELVEKDSLKACLTWVVSPRTNRPVIFDFFAKPDDKACMKAFLLAVGPLVQNKQSLSTGILEHCRKGPRDIYIFAPKVQPQQAKPSALSASPPVRLRLFTYNPPSRK